jgi:hypothetical protein
MPVMVRITTDGEYGPIGLWWIGDWHRHEPRPRR